MKQSLIFLFILISTPTLSKSNHIPTKMRTPRARKLKLGDAIADVRTLVQEKEKDNPLSNLFDPNHIRVAQQKIQMNMHVPLNRLKLDLGKDYKVRVIVHSDEDFARLYEYFYKKPLE